MELLGDVKALVMATASSIVAKLKVGYNTIIDKYLFESAFIIVAIGLGGYQANIIHFGIDKLNDASTDEIKSFIIWYL